MLWVPTTCLLLFCEKTEFNILAERRLVARLNGSVCLRISRRSVQFGYATRTVQKHRFEDDFSPCLVLLFSLKCFSPNFQLCLFIEKRDGQYYLLVYASEVAQFNLLVCMLLIDQHCSLVYATVSDYVEPHYLILFCT